MNRPRPRPTAGAWRSPTSPRRRSRSGRTWPIPTRFRSATARSRARPTRRSPSSCSPTSSARSARRGLSGSRSCAGSIPSRCVSSSNTFRSRSTSRPSRPRGWRWRRRSRATSISGRCTTSCSTVRRSGGMGTSPGRRLAGRSRWGWTSSNSRPIYETTNGPTTTRSGGTRSSARRSASRAPRTFSSTVSG